MRPPDPTLLHGFELLNAGRSNEAIAIFRQLAAADDPGALATLAELTWAGGLLAQDFVAGRRFYERAGDAGHIGCALYATNLLASGIAGKRDWAAAMDRLGREAATDPARAEMLTLIRAMALTVEGDPVGLPAIERLSETPFVGLYRAAFSPAECDYLIRLAEPNFQRALVIDGPTGRDRPDPVRTSEESHLHWLIENPAAHALSRRLAALTGTTVGQGEPLQILRYRPGQEYRSHFDYIAGAVNQRVLTALVYLNEDYDGGETRFTRTGLAVKGHLGDVLVFRNMGPDGRIDKLSEHAGLPVTRGTKFLASRWIRAREYRP